MRREEFISSVNEKGLILNERQLEQLDDYASFLAEYNEKINLTAIKEPEEIVEKHFYDCLLPLSADKIHGRAADIGSGAGFPGLVWKIAKPDLSMVLIEPTGKRCTFLKTVISELGLKDIEVVNQRSEDYVKEARETFDVVTARAVANLRVLCELCVPLVKKAGLLKIWLL